MGLPALAAVPARWGGDMALVPSLEEVWRQCLRPSEGGGITADTSRWEADAVASVDRASMEGGRAVAVMVLTMTDACLGKAGVF